MRFIRRDAAAPGGDLLGLAKRAVAAVEVPDGEGSGFFAHRPGLLVTNWHVVGRQRKCGVRTLDGHLLKGEVLAADRTNDLAVLHCEGAESLPVLPFARRPPQDGESVWAIGMPAGLEFSVTRGVVSHATRLYRGCQVIQTDVSLNPGNSGGPLLNAREEVMGVCQGGLRGGRQ